MFIDRTKIYVKAGNGGNGAVWFRREKYVSHGGPDGGDGGNGGNIIFRVDKGCSTLLTFRHKRKFVAQNGGNGSGSKFHGANGADVDHPRSLRNDHPFVGRTCHTRYVRRRGFHNVPRRPRRMGEPVTLQRLHARLRDSPKTVFPVRKPKSSSS